MCELISKTFDSGDVCFYAFVAFVRQLMPSFAGVGNLVICRTNNCSRVMTKLSMFGGLREAGNNFSH